MVRLHGDSSNTTTQTNTPGTGGKGPTQHPNLQPYSTLPRLNSTSLAAVDKNFWAPGTKLGGMGAALVGHGSALQGPRAQEIRCVSRHDN